MIFFTLPFLLLISLSDIIIIMIALIGIFQDTDHDKCPDLWHIILMILSVQSVTIVIKNIVIHKQKDDIRSLKALLRKFLFKFIYAINVIIIVAIFIKGMLDIECTFHRVIPSLYLFCAISLTQPVIALFIMDRLTDAQVTHQKGQVQWHPDIHAGIRKIFQEIPSAIKDELDGTLSYKVWKTIGPLRVPFKNQYNLIKLFTKLRNIKEKNINNSVQFFDAQHTSGSTGGTFYQGQMISGMGRAAIANDTRAEICSSFQRFGYGRLIYVVDQNQDFANKLDVLSQEDLRYDS